MFKSLLKSYNKTVKEVTEEAAIDIEIEEAAEQYNQATEKIEKLEKARSKKHIGIWGRIFG